MNFCCLYGEKYWTKKLLGKQQRRCLSEAWSCTEHFKENRGSRPIILRAFLFLEYITLEHNSLTLPRLAHLLSTTLTVLFHFRILSPVFYSYPWCVSRLYSLYVTKFVVCSLQRWFLPLFWTAALMCSLFLILPSFQCLINTRVSVAAYKMRHPDKPAHLSKITEVGFSDVLNNWQNLPWLRLRRKIVWDTEAKACNCYPENYYL